MQYDVLFTVHSRAFNSNTFGKWQSASCLVFHFDVAYLLHTFFLFSILLLLLLQVGAKFCNTCISYADLTKAQARVNYYKC